jgi:3-oxoacyl-[acyl-carrier-protein] synthase II
MRRVAVTGLGLLTPLGSGVSTNWQSLLEGKSGIAPLKSFDVSDSAVKIAGEIGDFFDITQWMTGKEAKRYDSFIHFAVAASDEALDNAGLLHNSTLDERIDRTRFGVCVGSGVGGLATIEKNNIALNEGGARRVSPFYVAGGIINMAAGTLSIRYGLLGPNTSPVSACTTGLHSLAWAYRMIQYNDADIMLAGASEQPCTPSGLAGFSAMRALSQRNDSPTEASRPWDRDRDGFVLSSGAGLVVLEEWESAKKRGAPIYGEIVGIGMSSDASHITQPSANGEGAARCMQIALQDAKINPHEIGYINAHGTSTPLGDIAEIQAIKKCFGEDAKNLLISSTKSMLGHSLGASGAIESIISLLALEHQKIPPTINLENPDEGCDLDLVPHYGRDAKIKYSLSNSFGFGGSNCSIVFAKA